MFSVIKANGDCKKFSKSFISHKGKGTYSIIMTMQTLGKITEPEKLSELVGMQIAQPLWKTVW